MILNRTILSVEDDENDVLFLRLALERVGLAVNLQVVMNGADAVDYLAGSGRFADRNQFPLPFLVLLDLKLPLLPGLDVFKWIREQEHLRSTIVVPLSASNHPRDVEDARTLGAPSFLVKPLDLAGWRNLARGIKEAWFQEELSHPTATGSLAR